MMRILYSSMRAFMAVGIQSCLLSVRKMGERLTWWLHACQHLSHGQSLLCHRFSGFLDFEGIGTWKCAGRTHMV